jgi:hypothetical protein
VSDEPTLTAMILTTGPQYLVVKQSKEEVMNIINQAERYAQHWIDFGEVSIRLSSIVAVRS